MTKSQVCAPLIVFLIVYLSRILYVTYLSVDIPWSDQWDGEIEKVYFKVLDGTLSLGNLWAQANEHRIVLTKLLNLLSFEFAYEQARQTYALYLQSVIFSLIPALLVFGLNKDRINVLGTVN